MGQYGTDNLLISSTHGNEGKSLSQSVDHGHGSMRMRYPSNVQFSFDEASSLFTQISRNLL
jgi:hypothetical protein